MLTQQPNHVTLSLIGRKEDLPYLLPYQTSHYIGWAAAGFGAGVLATAIFMSNFEFDKEHHNGTLPTTNAGVDN